MRLIPPLTFVRPRSRPETAVLDEPTVHAIPRSLLGVELSELVSSKWMAWTEAEHSLHPTVRGLTRLVGCISSISILRMEEAEVGRREEVEEGRVREEVRRMRESAMVVAGGGRCYHSQGPAAIDRYQCCMLAIPGRWGCRGPP